MSALRQSFGGSLRCLLAEPAEAAEQRRLVPLAGLEPARCFHHLILSQARLPIPPQGPRADYSGGRAGVNANAVLTSPRLRGEVGSRSDPGEGA
jgi:hypothetical protein